MSFRTVRYIENLNSQKVRSLKLVMLPAIVIALILSAKFIDEWAMQVRIYLSIFVKKNLIIYIEAGVLFPRIQELYYGISREDVEWVVDKCAVCRLMAAQKGKAPIRPIKTLRCLDRVQIDLMDFKVLADGEYKYILQIKDTFSRHIWLYPLKNRFAEDVYEVLIIWLGQNGYPSKFGADNGGEFKGIAFPTLFSDSNY